VIFNQQLDLHDKSLLYENYFFVSPLIVLSYRFCCYKHYSVGEIMSQISPSVPKVLSALEDDLLQWSFAGALGVSYYLLALVPPAG
jgi:hypothetical protein